MSAAAAPQESGRVRTPAGLELYWESRGPREGRPLVLIPGIGMQLVHWPAGFLDELCARGLRLILIDNRDAGLSDKHPAPPPSLLPLMSQSLFGVGLQAPYRLRDMADDAAALIAGLELEAPAVLGISMGGMVAQLLALRHPERVGRLTLLSTTSGSRAHRPRWRAARALFGPPSRTREESVARGVELMRVIGSPGFPYDALRQAEASGRAFDRCHCPAGFGRQAAAIASSPDRVAALRTLRAPTLVLHGEADPLVPISAGRELASLIPQSRLISKPGWGHDLPQALWSELGEAIGTWSKAEARSAR